ncbi:sulfotransferase family protein [Telmatospirillum siberiense]|uniref:sulfotransferase family protein n=1 Tax=Telmatospirillum siberiense TaxID=382514 RepID=UPI0013044FE7|nr:sulfotransferase [Telmatospirillum siberiense]
MNTPPFQDSDAESGNPLFSPEKLFTLGNALQSLNRGDEALTCYRRSLALDPTSAAAQANLGSVLMLKGQGGQAMTELRRALALDPLSAHIHVNLGDGYAVCGRHEAAADCYRMALVLEPQSAAAHYGLGNLRAALGHHRKACGHYRQALALHPDFAEAYNNLGNSLQGLKRADLALACHRAAVALLPGDAKSYNNLGSALQTLGGAGEALACYRRATTLAPAYAEAHYNIGTALLDTGDAVGAYGAFRLAIDLAPRRGCFHRMLAETGKVAPDGPDLRRMEDLAADMASLPEADRMELHFALSKVYADAGRQEDSFRQMLAGNRLKRQSLVYDEAATLQALARLPEIYTPELLARESKAGFSSRLPIFIVGMPRSGTTLIEQILASHPQVFGAGELRDLQHLADEWTRSSGLPLPEAAPLLPKEAWRRLGAAYVDAVARRAPGHPHIVDKMPGNFAQIGLIRLALPEAKIIHAVRDPVDTCLSFFSKLFSGRHPFAYDLAELGRYYRAYDALMAYWRRTLPTDVMLEVRYEEVVADMEGQARRILEHCGLEWDPRCLDFHRTQRVVRTASAMQVRQPLYATSVGRWHVYGDLARPLLDALEGVIMVAPTSSPE